MADMKETCARLNNEFKVEKDMDSRSVKMRDLAKRKKSASKNMKKFAGMDSE